MENWLNKIIRVLGWINIVFISVLTLLTLIDVFARYLFNTSFFDALTISSYLLAMINALALPGITMKGGHVQVELVSERLPVKVRSFFDSLNNLLAAGLFFCMSWYAFGKAIESFEKGYFQGWMELPEYPPKFVFACGCLITSMTFLALFGKSLSRRPETENPAPGIETGK
jgi:TRAP-type C4-dicarboxylate transport system permease small subunit